MPDAADDLFAGEEKNPLFFTAMKLCAVFERCGNYPRDVAGVKALARGLLWSSERTGIAMSRIVDEARQISTFCPSDADLYAVAQDLRGPAQAESIPIPPREQVRKAWQAFAGEHKSIMQRSDKWHKDFAKVCAKVRERMGMEKWMKSDSDERTRVAIEIFGSGDREQGLGQFVGRIHERHSDL